MIRKNQKFLLTILLIVMMSFSIFSSLSEATNVESISESSETTEIDKESDEKATAEEAEIHNGDLYLFGNKVVMDKLVDGNVFIIGQEVEITGQVNGNLFVCANKLAFNNCYVRYSVFACANRVYYNSACNDFYVFSSKDLEMTYDSYVVRNIKAFSSLIKFKAAVGRDADLSFNKIELGEGEDIPVVYGNLRYSAPSEIVIPEGVITETGSVTYTNSNSVLAIITNFLVCIVTAIVICIIIKTFAPKFATMLENEKLQVIKLVKHFAIGLVSMTVVTILFILLLITQIGINLGVIVALSFIILCLLATPIFAIIITNALKPILKLDKKPMFYLVLCLVSIVLYGVTLIPFVGVLFSLLIAPTSIGILINMIFPHKKLTDEEKALIEDKKKQAKEEKAEIKLAKKQAKLEAKKAKKENKD